MSNVFNIETLKGYTRTASANRVSAVQMIASGEGGKDCKANAVEAYTTTKELVGVDKVSVSIYKAISEMPASVWRKFPLASNDSKDGEKQATALVKLAQAWTLCSEADVGYVDGYEAAGHDLHIHYKKQELAQRKAATTSPEEPATTQVVTPEEPATTTEEG